MSIDNREFLIIGAAIASTATKAAAKATAPSMEKVFAAIKVAANEGRFSLDVPRRMTHSEIRTLQVLGYGLRHPSDETTQISW